MKTEVHLHVIAWCPGTCTCLHTCFSDVKTGRLLQTAVRALAAEDHSVPFYPVLNPMEQVLFLYPFHRWGDEKAGNESAPGTPICVLHTLWMHPQRPRDLGRLGHSRGESRAPCCLSSPWSPKSLPSDSDACQSFTTDALNFNAQSMLPSWLKVPRQLGTSAQD